MKTLQILLILTILSACNTSKSSTNAKNTINNQEVNKVRYDSLGIARLDSLKIFLKENIDPNINFNEKIVINYIDNDPRGKQDKNYQVPWDIFYGNIQNQLNKIESCNQYWLINKEVKNRHFYYGDRINWVNDKDSMVRKMFFDYRGYNGGVVILKPDGNYLIKNGEYSKADVLSWHKTFN